jgi:molybdopterin-guanine dinucleotide biosynthesis protein A
MGRDKARVALQGRSLLEWVLEALRQVCDEVLVVTSTEGLVHQRDAMGDAMGDARLIADHTPGRGPLGGLYTGLGAASADMVLLVGCDTPFLQPALLKRVVQTGAGRDAGVPRLEGIPQTLQATYARRCLPTIERLLAHGRPGLRDLLLLTDVAYLDTDEIIKTDPDLLSFFNVNSEADLERAKRLLEIGGGP